MPFIVVEGIDGSGKSTLLKGVADHLTRKKKEWLVTREPGGTQLAEEIRSLLLRTEGEAPGSRTELLLYLASRAQHVDQKIKPALKKGQWVLCDRFSASSYAYQASGRNIDKKTLQWMNDFAIDGCHPDLTVLIDLPLGEAIKRRKSRGEEDRIEKEKQEFHERVRQGYLEYFKDLDKALVIDGLWSPEDILKKTLQGLREVNVSID